jgi:hypothetical protein
MGKTAEMGQPQHSLAKLRKQIDEMLPVLVALTTENCIA